MVGCVTTGHPGHFVTVSDDDPRHTLYVALELSRTQWRSVCNPFSTVKPGSFVIPQIASPEAAFRLGYYLTSWKALC